MDAFELEYDFVHVREFKLLLTVVTASAFCYFSGANSCRSGQLNNKLWGLLEQYFHRAATFHVIQSTVSQH